MCLLYYFFKNVGNILTDFQVLSNLVNDMNNLQNIISMMCWDGTYCKQK